MVRHWKQSRAAARTTPGVPAVPQQPRPALPPPPSQAETGTTNIDKRYIYPGSRTTMIISREGEGDKVQLTTKDDVDKVADWYIAQFKPTKIVRMTGNAVLRSDEIAVIITAGGDGSNILLKQGGD